MKLVKLAMIALAASLVVGCASTSDIENLQTQVDGLKTSVAQAAADAASAAQNAQDTNSKLDSMFKKSMMK